jgi:hypothetical protein
MKDQTWIVFEQAKRLAKFARYHFWAQQRVREMNIVQAEAVKAAFNALDCS